MSKDGGPAFPEIRIGGTGTPGVTQKVYYRGMTLRDWFAGQALAGYNANPRGYEADPKHKAALACEDADAMLAELAKEE